MVTVIIPTYMRPQCIKKIIDECIFTYKGNFFTFEIHDSSQDDKTETIVMSAMQKVSCLKYFKYSSDILVDTKTLQALRNVLTSHFYVMGDGNLLNFNLLEFVLNNEYFENCQVLNIEIPERKKLYDSMLYYPDDRIIYSQDYVEFVKQYFSHMTYWGACIIKKEFLDSAIETGILDKYKNNIWWIAGVISETLWKCKELNNDINVGVICFSGFSINSSKSKAAHWTETDKYYDFVYKQFNECVNALPNVYDEHKKYMIRFFRNDVLTTRKFLFHQRRKGVLTYEKIKLYKKEICVIDGYWNYMLMLSFVPQFVCQIVYKIWEYIKRWNNNE